VKKLFLAAIVGPAAAALLAAGPKLPGLFRDVTKASGIKMEVHSDLPRLKLIATMIGGCALGDYDGDGRPDLYVTNSVPRWGKPNPDNCGRLFSPRPPMYDLSVTNEQRLAAVAALREAGSKRGWMHAGELDACPACVQKFMPS